MDQTRGRDATTTGVQSAEIVREYGPFSDAPDVHGVTFDGTHVWFAAGDALRAFDPSSGQAVRAIDVASDAGTAFDGRYFYQFADDRIEKADPREGSNRRDPSGARQESRLGPDVGRGRTLAWHMEGRPERDPPYRPRERQGSGPADHARRRQGVGPRVGERAIQTHRERIGGSVFKPGESTSCSAGGR
jgi:hypothetical protein